MWRRGAGLVAEKWQAAAGELRPAVGAPLSRSREGTLPGRSRTCATWKPRQVPADRYRRGKPTVRKA
jgi:hypothetical protein